MKLAPPLVVGAVLLVAGCGGDSGGGITEPPSQTVTVLDVQAQVFTPRCALSGCHVGANAPFGLDLSSASSSFANLVGIASAEIPSLSRVEPNDAPNSYLYMKVTDDPAILGDPMPLSGGPLGVGDLQLAEEWIDGGAN